MTACALRLAPFACILGCTTAHTPTSQLMARVDATLDDQSLKVNIALFAGLTSQGLPAHYEITPDEHVKIAFRDQTADLLFAPADLDDYDYRGILRVDGVVAADEEVQVLLERPHDTDATIAGTAPAPLALSYPAMMPSNQPLAISWSPIARELMTWHSSGCVADRDGSITDDTGSITFPVGALADPTFPYSCDLKVIFERTRSADATEPLKHSAVNVTQTKSAELMVVVP